MGWFITKKSGAEIWKLNYCGMHGKFSEILLAVCCRLLFRSRLCPKVWNVSAATTNFKSIILPHNTLSECYWTGMWRDTWSKTPKLTLVKPVQYPPRAGTETARMSFQLEYFSSRDHQVFLILTNWFLRTTTFEQRMFCIRWLWGHYMWVGWKLFLLQVFPPRAVLVRGHIAPGARLAINLYLVVIKVEDVCEASTCGQDFVISPNFSQQNFFRLWGSDA